MTCKTFKSISSNLEPKTCVLREIIFRLLGKTSMEKNVFFRALPELPNPPPLTPIWATWSFFCGCQNSRFEKKGLQKCGVGREIYQQPKKRLKVQYIGIFEEIDSFY